ncbi:MAG: VOC family protein [Hyphomicrobiaceae bacterium]
MRIAGLDHFVMTVASIAATRKFYCDVLGMEDIVFGSQERRALGFANCKINLHEVGHEFSPRARHAVAGSADICLIVDDLEAALTRLAAFGVPVELGPVPRTGANGSINSIYIRDPDDNLIELGQYEEGC